MQAEDLKLSCVLKSCHDWVYVDTIIYVLAQVHFLQLTVFLSVIGAIIAGGSMVKQPKGHFTESKKPTKDFDVNQIFVSPSIKYSGCEVYAKSKEWVSIL